MPCQCSQYTQGFDLVPSDLRLTPDEPRSLELAQPGEEKSVKTPRHKCVGDISSRTSLFKLLYSKPQMEHFSVKKKKKNLQDQSPTKNK